MISFATYIEWIAKKVKKMATSKRRKATKGKPSAENKEMHPLMYEILGLILIALAVIMIFEYGMIGRILQTIAMFLIGNLHFAVPFMLIFIALILMIGRKKNKHEGSTDFRNVPDYYELNNF